MQNVHVGVFNYPIGKDAMYMDIEVPGNMSFFFLDTGTSTIILDPPRPYILTVFPKSKI